MELYYEPREKAEQAVKEIGKYTEMSMFESAFLCGLIKEHHPKKILEVGVAAGGTTSIILQCIELLGRNDECEVFSVDMNADYYRENPKRQTGFLAEKIKAVLGSICTNFCISVNFMV